MADLEQELPALRFSIPPYESSTQIITERHWALEVLLKPTSAFRMHYHLPEIFGKGVPDETVPEHRLAGNKAVPGKPELVYLNILGKGPALCADVGPRAF